MRIALVHASSAALQAVTAAVTQQGEHELLWSARDGGDAIRRASEVAPELLLLDVSIANPDSAEVTRRIIVRSPCTIVLLADRPHAQTALIYEAMGAGAVDVTTCPVVDEAGRLVASEPLLAKLRTMAKMLGHGHRPHSARAPGPQRAAAPNHKLIAIGASTGGPQALFKILSGLPPALEVPIVIVQHVDSEFSTGLASWLQDASGRRVELARSGSRAEPGAVLLAASNDHLVLTARGTFAYTVEPRELPYRPSVDVLFASLAEHWPAPAVAVLLTGMGRDGARGMKRLKDAGWYTIAQDESSSVVFGMPKAAIELGAVEHVAALPAMAEAIARACT